MFGACGGRPTRRRPIFSIILARRDPGVPPSSNSAWMLVRTLFWVQYAEILEDKSFPLLIKYDRLTVLEYLFPVVFIKFAKFLHYSRICVRVVGQFCLVPPMWKLWRFFTAHFVLSSLIIFLMIPLTPIVIWVIENSTSSIIFRQSGKWISKLFLAKMCISVLSTFVNIRQKILQITRPYIMGYVAILIFERLFTIKSEAYLHLWNLVLIFLSSDLSRRSWNFVQFQLRFEKFHLK